jgi:lysophospholipase L1-like esterase
MIRLPHRTFLTGIALGIFGLVASGCAGPGFSVTPGAEPHVKPYTYVAVGGSESVGYDASDPVRQAFPILLDHQLPAQTVFYDLAVPGATTAGLLAHQETSGLDLHPNVVTIWVGLSDLESGESPSQFGGNLQRIVAPFRARGTLVLLANVEPITEAAAYVACAAGTSAQAEPGTRRCFVDGFFVGGMLPSITSTQALVAAYDTQVASVARRDSAVLVDVNAAISMVPQMSSSSFTADDFDLSTAGHALVARLFASAWRKAAGT